VYAIKTINKSEVTNRKQIRRIWDEREILSVARSEFVVKMYYTFETRDKLFLVMEYCPGGDLFALLELYGTLQPGTLPA
jgi:serine/threonine protein kinase